MNTLKCPRKLKTKKVSCYKDQILVLPPIPKNHSISSNEKLVK